MTDEPREAVNAFETASPEEIDGIRGTFVVPANLDQVQLVWEAAVAHLGCSTIADEKWLCVEKGNQMRPTNYISWAKGEGEPHCWFRGAGKHYPECGLYSLEAARVVHREET